MSLPAYAELHCLSDFSFQRGASTARELFERASICGYKALAITDECSMAGIVRAHEAARQTGVKLIVGTEVRLTCGTKLVLLAQDKFGYEALCALITCGRRAAEKGTYRLGREDLGQLPGVLVLWCPTPSINVEAGIFLRERFKGRLWIGVGLHRDQDDARRLTTLQELGRRLGVPLVAEGDVHMHIRRRRALQDVMTATRHNTTVAIAGRHLFPNGERHLRTRGALSNIYPVELIDETVRIAERCTFTLDELRYRYPSEVVPDGHTPASWLRALTEDGIAWRWPRGITEKVRAQIEHELTLIRESPRLH